MAELPHSQTIVILEPTQAQEAQTIAADYGVTVEQVPQRGIEPLTTVTLLLVGTAAAVRALMRELERRKGGQVIDLRPGVPKTFYRTSDVAYGTVIIIATDGEITVRVKDPDILFGKATATIPELLSSNGNVKQAAKTVAEALGMNVEIDDGTSGHGDDA